MKATINQIRKAISYDEQNTICGMPKKKKSKKFKENEIKTMLEKNWSVKPKLIANEFETALFDLVNKFCKDGLSKPDLIKKMEYVTQSCRVS